MLIADALQAGASQFEASAGKLKRKFWWKNMKVKSSLIFGDICSTMYIINRYSYVFITSL